MPQVLAPLDHPPVTFTLRAARRLREAQAHQAAGRPDQALALYEQVLDAAPDHGEAAHRLGVLLDMTGERERAVAMLTRAAVLRADRFAPHHDLGLVLTKLGRHEEAIAAMRHAASLAPDDAEVQFGLGNALLSADRFDEAAAVFRESVTLAPDHMRAWSNLAACYRRLDRLMDAIDCARRAAALSGTDGLPHAVLGELLLGAGEYREAADVLQTSIAMDPQATPPRTNLGVALMLLGEPEAALAQHRLVLERKPDDWEALSHLAFPLLSLGQFEEGWRLYEGRFHHSPSPAAGLPAYGTSWLGEPALEGRTITLIAEQGMGDAIQFCRYAPLIRARGAHVQMQVPEPLVGLLRPLADRVIAFNDPVPDTDFHCMLMSLPHAMGTTLHTIPADVPYLHVTADHRARWQTRLGARRGLRVGVAWSGNPVHPDDRLRSIGCEDFLHAVAVPGIELHALQRDIRDSDAVAAATMPSYGSELSDFQETAALIEAMDLVISVDTSVVHLAGALARPVWVLLAFGADYRWLLHRTDSPWYPTARLFRQTRFNQWDDVLDRVRAALAELVGAAPA